MKGDFTRNTYDPRKAYSRVLMQQGRVQLDADWNEQAAILLHYLRAITADILGPHAGPGSSFSLGLHLQPDGKPVPYDFSIAAGHYYVDGILCEGRAARHYSAQRPDYPLWEEDKLQAGLSYLAYLDVWERHITYVQDDNLREVALGGADTTTRTKIVWQVKVTVGSPRTAPSLEACPTEADWRALVEGWQPRHRGLLQASAQDFEPDSATEPCAVAPESRYRGAENQLYRVEIHRGGLAWDGAANRGGVPAGNAESAATFKWSRENGSVVFPILSLNGVEARLEHLGRDDRFSLHPGDWVEVIDDAIELHAAPGVLLKVHQVEREAMTVTLEVPAGVTLPVYDETNEQSSSTTHPLLRRWDYQALEPSKGYPYLANDRALLIQEGEALLLEDGVQITFVPPENGSHSYRTGDYWLIPARTATGEVEWPTDQDTQAPAALPPLGVYHHYAPLGLLVVGDAGAITIGDDCRCTFEPMASCENESRG